MKKSIYFILIFLFIIIITYTAYISLTTFTPNNYRKEIEAFNKQYNSEFDTNKSTYLDKFVNKNEVFNLFEYNGNYFIIWIKKSIWQFGRYKIEGGSFPAKYTNKVNNKLSEFQKYDSNGYIYIIYGPAVYNHIDIQINDKDNTPIAIKEYDINKSYTFVVYSNIKNVISTPIYNKN
jgi:hypothetical protein